MFGVISQYNGYRLNHVDFQNVSQTTYKTKKVDGSQEDKDNDAILLCIEDQYVPVFYHCGNMHKLLSGEAEEGQEETEILGIEDGASAFYEFKDKDSENLEKGEELSAIVAYQENEPTMIVGFGDYVPRFCCPEPFLKEVEKEPFPDITHEYFGPTCPKTGYFTMVGEWEDSPENPKCPKASGHSGVKEIEGIMQHYAEMKVSVARCSGVCNSYKNRPKGSFAEAYDVVEVDVKSFGEKHGIPYMCDCDIVLNFDSDCNGKKYGVGEAEKGTADSVWVTVHGEDDYISNGQSDIKDDCYDITNPIQYPRNERIVLPGKGPSDELMEKVYFTANVWVAKPFDYPCGWPTHLSKFVNLKYIQIEPSDATLKEMNKSRKQESE